MIDPVSVFVSAIEDALATYKGTVDTTGATFVSGTAPFEQPIDNDTGTAFAAPVPVPGAGWNAEVPVVPVTRAAAETTVTTGTDPVIPVVTDTIKTTFENAAEARAAKS